MSSSDEREFSAVVHCGVIGASSTTAQLFLRQSIPSIRESGFDYPESLLPRVAQDDPSMAAAHVQILNKDYRESYLSNPGGTPIISNETLLVRRGISTQDISEWFDGRALLILSVRHPSNWVSSLYRKSLLFYGQSGTYQEYVTQSQRSRRFPYENLSILTDLAETVSRLEEGKWSRIVVLDHRHLVGFLAELLGLEDPPRPERVNSGVGGNLVEVVRRVNALRTPALFPGEVIGGNYYQQIYHLMRMSETFSIPPDFPEHPLIPEMTGQLRQVEERYSVTVKPDDTPVVPFMSDEDSWTRDLNTVRSFCERNPGSFSRKFLSVPDECWEFRVDF